MRTLALETSTLMGSLALVEDGVVRLTRWHDEPNRHAERMLPLIADSLRELGWTRPSIDRVAVGVGPGTFTGIRVGLSLAMGLSLGLGAEALGVGSLRILAAGHPEADRRLRVVVRDARRDEYFLSAYSAEGEELLAPLPIPQAGAAEELERRWGQTPYVLLGQRLPGCAWEHGEDEQVPQAAALGLLSEHLDAATHPVQPQYVRGPGAGQPKLALSPLRLPRS